MGHQWITAACRMVRRGERTVEPMTRRTRTDRSVLVVRVTGEMSRLGAICLVEAYEQAVPITRRRPGDERIRRMERQPGGPHVTEEVGQ